MGSWADDELGRQIDRLEPILDISPSAIAITDLDTTVVAWNAAAERLFGYTAEEAVGHNLDDLVAATEELHSDAVTVSEVTSSERGVVHRITRRTRKDGALVDVKLQAAPLIVEGRAVGILGVYHDVTELNRQRRYLEALLEVSPEAIVTTDLDDKVSSWNPAAERLFGYTAEEAVGRDINDLVASRPDLHAEGMQLSQDAMDGSMVHHVTQRTRKDGSLVDVDIVGGPVTVGDEIVGRHVFYHDISELQQQKRYFESLLEISPAAIIVTDLETSKVVSWNPAAERLFGYPRRRRSAGTSTTWWRPGPELHDEAVSGSARRAAEGERVQFIARRTRKDGSLVDVQAVSEPVVVAEERIGYVVIYHDISELQQQKRYYETLLEVVPTAIVGISPEGIVTSWNPAAERLFGYTAEEAVGRDIDNLVAAREDLREEARENTRRALCAGRAQWLGRRTRKDGSLVDVQVTGAPIHVGGQLVGIHGIFHDITELQQQRRYYESLFQYSPVAIALLDVNATVTAWNPAAEALFGYSAEEAIGHNVDSLVANREEIRTESDAYSARGLRGELVHAMTQRTRNDGTLVDVEMFAAPVTVAEEAAGFYAIYHDIRELQQARRDAEVATEAKSAFLATMSHEIRTPLNAVIGMTGLLLDTELTPEQRGFAEVIRGSGDALLAVINDILDFSKIEAGRLDLESVPFDLRDCVESALELAAANALRKGLDLAYDLDPSVPGALVGDATRLRQVLINLLNNAVKFTERGEVVVTVGAEPLAPDDRYRLHFSVRDTGIGIPADRMDGLFESFTQVDPSTTRRYGGTGLGLAISNRLVELMSGTMWAESVPGEGSTFHFSIEADATPAPIRAYERSGSSPACRAPCADRGRQRHEPEDPRPPDRVLGHDLRRHRVPREALRWIERGRPVRRRDPRHADARDGRGRPGPGHPPAPGRPTPSPW